jgi:hypothetical protein
MNGISDTIWAVLIGVVMLAALFMLVRPGSPTVAAINAIGDGLADLVGVTTNNYNGGS